MAALSQTNDNTKQQLDELKVQSATFREEYVVLKDEFRDFARVNQTQVVTIAKQVR